MRAKLGVWNHSDSNARAHTHRSDVLGKRRSKAALDFEIARTIATFRNCLGMDDAAHHSMVGQCVLGRAHVLGLAISCLFAGSTRQFALVEIA